VDTILADEFECGPAYAVGRSRGTPDWLLILTIAGEGLIRTSKTTHRLPAGHAVLYAPGTPQDYRTAPGGAPWRIAWAHFLPRAHWQAWLSGWPHVAPGTALLDLTVSREEVTAALRRTAQARRRPIPGAADFALNALEEALLWADSIRGGSRWARGDERVRRAMDYLATTVDEPFSLNEVARHCGLSPSRLANRFRAQTGQSLQRYSEGLRMDRARLLLMQTPATVAEVASACGYADAFYFTRRFTLATGKCPSAWRKVKAAG
jgi:AraC family transcriptional regulator of arabinose operon